MTQPETLERITQALLETMSPKAIPRELIWPRVQIMRRLSEGRAVLPSEVARIWGRPSEEARAALAHLAETGMAELDDEGSVVGMIITVKPTRHRFETDRAKLYTWCAIDTLFMPAVLQQSAEIESTCPETGARIRLAVAPDRIESTDPSSVYVSLVAPGVTPGVEARCGAGMSGLTGAEGAFCGKAHFLESRKAAQGWLRKNQGAVVLPVKEAFDLARRVWSDPFLECLSEG